MSRRPRVEYLDVPRRRGQRDPYAALIGFVVGIATGAALVIGFAWPW